MSAGAVLLSIWVSSRQHALDGKRQRNANREAEIDKVNGVITMVRLQLAAFEKVAPWVSGQQAFDKDLHSELHSRSSVISAYQVHVLEPLDARWLVIRVQNSIGGALKYYQRVWDQRCSTGVKVEPVDSLVEKLQESLGEARADLVALSQWREQHRSALE